MNKDSEVRTDLPARRRFLSWPRTRLGWWAVGLSLAVLLLPLLTALVNVLLTSLSGGISTGVGMFGLLMVLCGIAGGITGLIAVVRSQERSILVWGAILVGLFCLFLIAGEFLFPH
jgi:uncharacterized membrane protein YidH (DUF202 family)